MYNELRFSTLVRELKEVIDGKMTSASPSSDSGTGSAASSLSGLKFTLHLTAPLCCGDGHPTLEERQSERQRGVVGGGWWQDRARGGGALGA